MSYTRLQWLEEARLLVPIASIKCAYLLCKQSCSCGHSQHKALMELMQGFHDQSAFIWVIEWLVKELTKQDDGGAALLEAWTQPVVPEWAKEKVSKQVVDGRNVGGRGVPVMEGIKADYPGVLQTVLGKMQAEAEDEDEEEEKEEDGTGLEGIKWLVSNQREETKKELDNLCQQVPKGDNKAQWLRNNWKSISEEDKKEVLAIVPLKRDKSMLGCALYDESLDEHMCYTCSAYKNLDSHYPSLWAVEHLLKLAKE